MVSSLVRKVIKLLTAGIVVVMCLVSCNKNTLELRPVTCAQFAEFVSATNYVTDAEKFGWSVVQVDVYNFVTVDGANWRKPDGRSTVTSEDFPVTQVSYNDAKAYCTWANKRLPTYEEFWEIANQDQREIVSNNTLPISNVSEANIIGNVWDITEAEKPDSVRLAGGSLFCSESTCHGTVQERELYVDKETANIHIGFSVLDR